MSAASDQSSLPFAPDCNPCRSRHDPPPPSRSFSRLTPRKPSTKFELRPTIATVLTIVYSGLRFALRTSSTMQCSHARPPACILVSHRVSEQPCCSFADDGLWIERRRPGSVSHAVSVKRERAMPSFRVRPGRRPWRAMAEAGGVADTRQEVFEAAAEKALEGDTLKRNGGAAVSESGARGAAREVEVERTAEEQGIDWENAPTMPDELKFAHRHPMDPHKPNFSVALPEPLRPYPSFEGWFVRIWDPKEHCSAAVILATNYATDESQVTLLFTPGKRVQREGGKDSVTSGYTYAVAAKTKDARFMKKEHDQEWGDDRGEEPEGFEWEANGLGRIVVTPHVTDLDFTVEGYHFKAHLTKELLWDAHKSEEGPEGWARFVTIAPTHWYVYSLGSAVEYSFSNSEKEIHSEGSAYGHVEKNWGQTFPAGHIWMQAFSADNTSQVCCTGAYFKTPDEKFTTPYLFVLGYRSPKLQLDFRTNDLGVVFKDINLAARDSPFSVTAVGPSHTVEVKAYAPYDTFSKSVLAPVTKTGWEPACRETYVATAEIKVYEHVLWGVPGTVNLVETQRFEFAALELGEDLLTEGTESEDN